MELSATIDARRISSVSDLICNAYKGASLNERPRPHIGASIAGHDCGRYIWLTFRWAFYYQIPKDGRIELLLKRGQREEEYVEHHLRVIGLNPQYMTFKQLDIDFGCHVKCHPDGIIPGGIPEAPKAPHNLEIKTHNEASFRELVKHGVEEAKPQHYVQMQIEMYGEKYIHKQYPVERSLYYAVNKNTDELYTERIALDKELAEKYIGRCKNLALEDHIPSKLAERPDFFKCRFCDFHDFCHGGKMLAEVNCRTCAHSTAKKDGTFFCEIYKDTIPLEVQYKACPAHVYHPDLVPWKLVERESTEHSACYDIPGMGKVLNGYEGRSSEEIEKELTNDAEYTRLKNRTERIPDPNDIVPF